MIQASSAIRFSLATTLLFAMTALQAQNPVLTEWVESNPLNESNKIALGYSVPEPVDTPLPFDGFRTYAGLHARHQDLAATTPWVHPETVGLTRMGRTIWAYRLGDTDRETLYGLPEPAMLTNGGIHAREWQTPETVTGILELIATHENDDYFYDYLRENVNMVVIPSLNIDGFLQTQRYPSLNYLGVDDRYPNTSPRDGRMRRKNMLNADESLETLTDLLDGVDLNRNNSPFWNTAPGSSSTNPDSLIYHGAQPASEPEIQALDAAAQLGPAEQLRIYTDVHSFSQVHFWSRGFNSRLAAQTQLVLGLFSNHHRQFPARKWYSFNSARDLPINQGIGTTDEYFTHTYEVPSWTLEVEPSGTRCGADYGGEANNCHDGFILPESEIRRVREQLAQSFAAVYYRQAGPPSIQALRLIDEVTGAVVHEAEWDVTDPDNRTLFENTVQALQPGRQYRLWLAFNKPMRWREDGIITAFPGRTDDTLSLTTAMSAGGGALQIDEVAQGWLNEGFEAPAGYLNYRDDAYFMDFIIADTAENRSALSNDTHVSLAVATTDMAGLRLDANPATVVSWESGAWSGYESIDGETGDSGGADIQLKIPASTEAAEDPFVLEPGIAGAWYDLDHDGEGFLFDMLANGVVVLYWFTYDADGQQDWYIAVGEVRGNRAVFPELLRVSGGVFGEAFDPDLIVEEVVGSAKFTFSGCSSAEMDWRIGNRSGRQSVSRLTKLMGLDCGLPRMSPITQEALLSGSWFDPSHDGEGLVLEMLTNGQALVFWFSYGPDGARRWYFGVGDEVDGALIFSEMLTTSGGIFGDAFDPQAVEEIPWGSLQLELECRSGRMTWNSTETGFGSGQLQLVHLTQHDGLECPD